MATPALANNHFEQVNIFPCDSISNISLFNCCFLLSPFPFRIRFPYYLFIALPIFLGENSEQAIELSSRLNGWLRGVGSSNWELAIREILLGENAIDTATAIQSPKDFMHPCKPSLSSLVFCLNFNLHWENFAFSFLFLLQACPLPYCLSHLKIILDREIPFGQPLCSTQLKWCTTSTMERDKCEIARAAGISTGVYPIIECLEPSGSVVGCLYDVSSGRADFTGIDSNFGFLAR